VNEIRKVTSLSQMLPPVPARLIFYRPIGSNRKRCSHPLSWIWCISFLTLASCEFLTNPPTPVDTTLQASGKVIISTQGGKNALNFRWVKNVESDVIDLWGPMGSHRTRIELGERESRVLLPDGSILDETAAQIWVADLLGTEATPRSLLSWLNLEPDSPQLVSNTSFDGTGKLVAFEEYGWRIKMTESTNIGKNTVPKRVLVRKDSIELDIRFSN